MADKQINIVIGADISKLEKGFKDAVKIIGASGKTIDSEMEAVVRSIEKDFERIATSPNTKRTVTQLQNLALKVQALGPEFQDMANKIIKSAGEIKDKVGDAGAQIQYFSSDTRRIDAVVSAAQGVAGAFGIAEGAAALFGSKNEELQKTLAKVQGAIALLNGIQAVQNVLQQESAAMTGLNAAAQQLLAVKTYATASAMNALKVALVATGIGVAVVLLASFASAMSSASEEGEKLAKSIEKANKEAEESAKAGFDSQKNWADKRLGELAKELQAQGKSNLEILKVQEKFLRNQRDLRIKEYTNTKTNQVIKESLYKDAMDLESQRYSTELDIQIASNEEKKKRYDEALKNYQKFVQQKQDLDKELNKLKPQNVGGNLDMPMPSVEAQGGMLAIAKKQKQDLLTFTEQISGDLLAADKNYNDKKYTLDMQQVAQLRANLAANQAATNERIKQREREKAIQDQYIADNEQFVADINKAFEGIQTDAYAQIGQNIGNALMNRANVLQSTFSVILNSVAQFAETYGKALIAAAVASEAFQKLLIANPVLAIGAGIALVAASTIVKSVANKGVTAFADGGIVSGPTLGLMGEYPGASSNPEVIAPLDKLRGMLVPQNNGGSNMALETRFDGRDLYLAVKKYERDSRRG